MNQDESSNDLSSKGALPLYSSIAKLKTHAAWELQGSRDADTCSKIRIIRHHSTSIAIAKVGRAVAVVGCSCVCWLFLLLLLVLADYYFGWKKWVRIRRTASSSSQQVWFQQLTRKDLKHVRYVQKILRIRFWWMFLMIFDLLNVDKPSFFSLIINKSSEWTLIKPCFLLLSNHRFVLSDPFLQHEAMKVASPRRMWRICLRVVPWTWTNSGVIFWWNIYEIDIWFRYDKWYVCIYICIM